MHHKLSKKFLKKYNYSFGGLRWKSEKIYRIAENSDKYCRKYSVFAGVLRFFQKIRKNFKKGIDKR